MTTMPPQSARDDRMLPETRGAALIVFLILIPATAILWVAPGRTADLWAWMACVTTRRARRLDLRRADADRDGHPLGPLQPR